MRTECPHFVRTLLLSTLAFYLPPLQHYTKGFARRFLTDPWSSLLAVQIQAVSTKLQLSSIVGSGRPVLRQGDPGPRQATIGVAAARMVCQNANTQFYTPLLNAYHKDNADLPAY